MLSLRCVLACIVCVCAFQSTLEDKASNTKLLTRRISSNINVNIRAHKLFESNLLRKYILTLQKNNIYKNNLIDSKLETRNSVLINQNNFLGSVNENGVLHEIPKTRVLEPPVTPFSLITLTTSNTAREHMPDGQADLARGQQDESDDDGPSMRGTAPPFVCDLCPTTVDSKNPLSPCTCVGNSGSLAGEISITCPPSTATTEQLHDLFTHTDFFTTSVFRFTLQGSNVSGVLSQELWGDLTFTQVIITDNKINHVDNKAFNNSANTLTLLNLDNNEISYYVTSGTDDLPKLTTLVLKRNRIPIVFTNAFSYASLTVLDLSSNLIDTIGKDAFAALDKLQELYLDHNLLTKVDDDCFRFFNHKPDNNFLTLDLSFNKISYISEYAFRGLRNVQINLQSNHLTTITETVFKPIILDSQFFVFLSFSGNNITCDCKILWIVEDSSMKSCFDNFMCANLNVPVYLIDPEDLGNCTRHSHVRRFLG
nr:uncharacterized protein LOC128687403 [Cherax quadricarinatus]